MNHRAARPSPEIPARTPDSSRDRRRADRPSSRSRCRASRLPVRTRRVRSRPVRGYPAPPDRPDSWRTASVRREVVRTCPRPSRRPATPRQPAASGVPDCRRRARHRRGRRARRAPRYPGSRVNHSAAPASADRMARAHRRRRSGDRRSPCDDARNSVPRLRIPPQADAARSVVWWALRADRGSTVRRAQVRSEPVTGRRSAIPAAARKRRRRRTSDDPVTGRRPGLA